MMVVQIGTLQSQLLSWSYSPSFSTSASPTPRSALRAAVPFQRCVSARRRVYRAKIPHSSATMPPGATPSESTPLLPNQSPQANKSVSVNLQTPAPAQATFVAENATGSTDDIYSQNIEWRRMFRFIGPYIIPQTFRLRVLAAFSFSCIVLAKLAYLLPPLALKWAVDTLANNAMKPADQAVIPLAAVLLFCVGQTFGALFGALRSVTYAMVSSENTKRFSVNVFRHLQHLDLSYHIRRKTGEVNRIMDRGADSIDTLMNTFLFTLAPTMLEAVLVTAIFLHLGTPAIAVVTFCSVVLYAWYTKAVTEQRIRVRRQLINADNAVSEKAVDTLINYETVKMFGMEEYEVESYSSLQQEYLDLNVKLRTSLGLLNFGQSFIRTAGVSISLCLAAIGAARGRLSPGDFVLINAYIAQLFMPLSFLGTSYRIIVRAGTNIEKCIKLFETHSEVVDREDAVPVHVSEKDLISKQKGEIAFNNVSFLYKADNRANGGIQNISFTVRPGRMLGIVGASGSGKSTLIRICMRLYDPDEGSVTIDGVDIRNFTQQSLRRLFGVVSQETSLFNKTLRYNISYGKIGASDVEIYTAAKAAELSEFCESLPLQLDTVVGERGVRLSGGEKQRVGVARCVIRAPIIVLLDEASSSLDSETEREMQANLRNVCQGRTTIAVAHRLSTVMMADELIVLDNARIVERGTHSELLVMGGKYAAMWAAQTDTEKIEGKKKEEEGAITSNGV